MTDLDIKTHFRFPILLMIIIGLLVIIVLVGVWILMQTFMNTTEDSTTTVVSKRPGGEVAEAIGYRDAGDTEKAIEILTPLLSDVDDHKRGVATRLLAGLNLRDDDTQLDALALLKSIIADESIDARERAQTADYLFAIYGRSYRSSEMFSNIFDGEPFGHLLSSGERQKDMVRQATEQMLEVFETSVGNMRVADWYASELLDNKSLDLGQKEAYQGMLLMFAQRGADEYRKNKRYGDSSFSNKDVKYTQRRIFHSAAFAHIDPSDTTLFESDMETLKAKVTGSDKEDVQDYLPLLHFYHAAYLDLVFGESREEDIVQQIEELMLSIEADNQNADFIHRYIASTLEEPVREQYYIDTFFARLALYSPEFEVYLVQNGLLFK